MSGIDAAAPELAAIGIGSNLGDRAGMIRQALRHMARLPRTKLIAVSSIIETDPVGPLDQGRFLNAAAILRTSLEPRALLDSLLAIEALLGRDRRSGRRWGPRTIDLDILLYGQRVVEEGGLTIPHRHLAERPFALTPLAEIADSWMHPVLGVTIQCLRAAAAAAVADAPAAPHEHHRPAHDPWSVP